MSVRWLPERSRRFLEPRLLDRSPFGGCDPSHTRKRAEKGVGVFIAWHRGGLADSERRVLEVEAGQLSTRVTQKLPESATLFGDSVLQYAAAYRSNQSVPWTAAHPLFLPLLIDPQEVSESHNYIKDLLIAIHWWTSVPEFFFEYGSPFARRLCSSDARRPA
jgi:hypothetical protein